MDSQPFPELIKKILNSAVVVVPSLTEGFGFTAAESSALGKPVLATSAGSLPEVIKHNNTGIIVRSNSINSLCKGMEKILNKKLRSKFAANGPKYVKKFNYKKTLKEHGKIYGEIIKNAN